MEDSRTGAGSIQESQEHLVVTETKEGVCDNDGVLCPEVKELPWPKPTQCEQLHTQSSRDYKEMDVPELILI